MKTLISSLIKKSFVYILVLILIGSCAIPVPIPEQNFNSNITSEEYEVFDQSALSILDFQNEKAEKNRMFLVTLEKHATDNMQYKSWYDKALAAQKIKSELEQTTNEIWNEIVLSSGGNDVNGYPLGADQKIAAEKILLSQGKAKVLQKQISKTKEDWLGLISVNDEAILNNTFTSIFKDNDWVSKNTQNLKIGVLQLSFAHLLYETESTHQAILKYFWGKIKSPPLVASSYEIVSSPKNSYIITGDKYEADVFLAPVISNDNNNLEITINGRRMPLQNGVAKLKVATRSIGEENYNVVVKYKDPLSGETTTQKKSFNYKVGETSIYSSADKMNVFYIGVDNPISISAIGFPSKDLKVSMMGGSITKRNNAQYIVRVERTGECKIFVEANGIKKTSRFRVKYIPSPIAKLAGQTGGEIDRELFKSELGLNAVLENFDFDARCKVFGFDLSHIRPKGEIVKLYNEGYRYTMSTKELIRKAETSDLYLFENVMARCPGDTKSRMINSMIFKIK